MNNNSNLLILGSGQETKNLLDRSCGNGNSAKNVLGCISLNGSGCPEFTLGVPILGNSKVLCDYVFRNSVDLVVVSTSLPATASEELLAPILDIGLTVCVPDGVTTSLSTTTLQKIHAHRKSFFGIDATYLTTLPQKRGYLLAKRILDVVASSAGLVVLAPLFLLIAAIIKISSPSDPVFYPWRVLGKNGKPFTGYKFRTMVPDADKLKEQLSEFNEMDGPAFKMRNDPRVLPFGRYLRKFSLDELPQLYSVLKGDMSLVGPRPPSRQEAEQFEFWQRRKLSVKPGITCLWQVSGRNEIRAFEEWARLDLKYIDNASFGLDLKILLLTIPAVLSGRGAS